GGETTLRIHVSNDFGITNPSELPALGEKSRNLKINSERWNSARDRLTLEVSGIQGKAYELTLLGSARILAASGAELGAAGSEGRKLRIVFPSVPGSEYTQQQVELQLAPHASR